MILVYSVPEFPGLTCVKKMPRGACFGHERMSTLNIGTLLTRHARYRPDHSALVVGNRRLSFRELNTRVNKLSNAMLMSGARKGQKFATVLTNCLELMTAYWAAAKTGVVIVPCSTLLQETGLMTLLRDSNTVLVLADASFAGTLDRIRGELPDLLENGIVLVGDWNDHTGSRHYDEWVGMAPGSEPADPKLSDSDVYNIMYSSGTTGAPKGIVHSHYVRAMYCTLFASAFRITPESVVLHAGAIVDGWLHTGDAGYLDDEGFLFLVDRMKDMIISGGVNVYPKDIEEVIIRHPAVIEVAVFGVPDAKWGETPVAAVIPGEGHSVVAADLLEWTNSRVDAKFQRISEVIVMDFFPRNVAGKTLKRELREQYRRG